MILIVDERGDVMDGYASCFDREGIPASAINPADFGRWIQTASEADLQSVDAILIGCIEQRIPMSRAVKMRSRAALIAMNDQRSLDETLELFAAGVDDVVRKPVHVREILARVAAIRRRQPDDSRGAGSGSIRVFFDGRDPEVAGDTLRLPRRERRILEFLVSKRGRRATKAQIFNAVYGLFNEAIDDTIIESHVSKLRKRLRHRLGYDPIDSQRYLGYCITVSDV
jgi:two-component system, OmpR family, flagellar system response regulator FtcR